MPAYTYSVTIDAPDATLADGGASAILSSLLEQGIITGFSDRNDEVYVLYVPTHDDPVYLFDSEANAKRFAHVVAEHGSTPAPPQIGIVNDAEGTSYLIDAQAECECGASGYLWPMATNGDDSREWVERCDLCERYRTDEDAADALAAELAQRGFKVTRGTAIPDGLSHEHPYIRQPIRE